MLHLILLAVLGASYPQWQSYTNTNFVNDLAGDDSVLCCATNGGVVVLDIAGSPAMRRTLVNSDGLTANRCLCISRDADRNLWVGTDGGGLAVIEADSVVLGAYRASELPATVRAMAWDVDVLLLGSDQGLYAIDTRGTLLDFADDVVTRLTFSRFPGLLSDRVLSVGVSDHYWIGTNRGVTSVDRGFSEWQPWRQPFGDSVRAIAFWKDSVVVATERGVAIKESTGFRPVFPFAESTAVYELVVSGGKAYLATTAGLYQADGMDSLRFQLVLEADVRTLHFAGAIWVGCGGSEQAGSGLRYAQTGQSWQSFSNNCIWSAITSDCAIGPKGDLYVCSNGGAISAIDSTGRVSLFWSVLPVPVQVRIDSKGRLWFGHFAGNGGLAMHDPATGEWERIQWGAQSSRNIITAMGLDAADTKWVFGGGATPPVIAVDSAGVQEVFAVAGVTGPPGGGYEFAFDSRRRVWLGLTSGLVMIDYAGTLHDQSDDSDTILAAGLPSAEVRSVAVDGLDHVWVATPQGVAVWNGISFQVFRTSNSGILADNVYRVRVDASDRVWLLTEAGLSVYDQVARTWLSYTPQNSGIVANTQGIVGFYTALALSNDLGLALIGSQRGLSLFDYSVPAESSAEHLRVYPNPCVLGVHDGVVIDGLPYDATSVDVRTLEGRLLAELPVEGARHQAVWRPTGVATGLYLLVLRSPRGVRVERVALVRP